MSTQQFGPFTEADEALRTQLLASEFSSDLLDAEFQKYSNATLLGGPKILTASDRILDVARRAGGNVVIGGQAAAIMHGTRWYDHDFVIEVFRHRTGCNKPTPDTRVHRTKLKDSDIMMIDDVCVTTPIRTAFDIGRIAPPWRGLGNMDALQRATGFDIDELARFVAGKARQRGIRQVRVLIPLIDGGAESHPESWLRLLIIVNGLPIPETQIEVFNEYGQLVARLDMGYRDLRIGIEYDGEAYHSSPEQLASDQERDAELKRLDWHIIRVRNTPLRTEPWMICTEVRQAIIERGGYIEAP